MIYHWLQFLKCFHFYDFSRTESNTDERVQWWGEERVGETQSSSVGTLRDVPDSLSFASGVAVVRRCVAQCA